MRFGGAGSGQAQGSGVKMARSCDQDWVERLASALSRVHDVQGDYLVEMAERRQQRALSERDFPRTVPAYDPARDLDSFHHQACYGEGSYFERRYEPLRVVLHDAMKIVGVASGSSTGCEIDKVRTGIQCPYSQ